MEHIGSEFIVVLNDPQLRQGLIRDAERSRRSGQGANGSHVLRRWFAQTLHGLASRVDPASRTLDLQSAATRPVS
jgi:hypothetical protein